MNIFTQMLNALTLNSDNTDWREVARMKDIQIAHKDLLLDRYKSALTQLSEVGGQSGTAKMVRRIAKEALND